MATNAEKGIAMSSALSDEQMIAWLTSEAAAAWASALTAPNEFWHGLQTNRGHMLESIAARLSSSPPSPRAPETDPS